MKNILCALVVLVGIFTVFTLNFPNDILAGSGNCYLCGSDSKDGIQQCRYHGSDPFEKRKKCQAAGCKITGTGSCSTAANVKVIDPN